MSSMNFVATSVFFAQMAYIENLGVRNVLLSDGSTIEGGMCHRDVAQNGASLGLGNVRLWLGGSNPTEGKIRGYRDGTFVAAGGKAVFDKDGNTTIANLTAKSGKFTGEVKADLFYSSVKVNAESGYHINPDVDAFNTFYWEYDGVKPEDLGGVYAHRIYLPDAVRYGGIELCFMWTDPNIEGFEHKELYIYSIDNQIINVPRPFIEAEINGSLTNVVTISGPNVSTLFFSCYANQYFRVKSMNGQWFVISGYTYAE